MRGGGGPYSVSASCTVCGKGTGLSEVPIPLLLLLEMAEFSKRSAGAVDCE